MVAGAGSPVAVDDPDADTAAAPPLCAHVAVALSQEQLADKLRRRLKHREYVKKSYQKKLTTMQTLKHELEALERQYNAMLPLQQQQHQFSPAQQQPPEWARLLQKYVHLAHVKAAFQRENAQLYQQNAEVMKVETRVQQLLDAEPEVADHQRHFQFTSLPEAAYAQLIASARDDILQFANDAQKLSTGSQVFGWTDQRKIAGDELKFALEKHFETLSAHDLVARSWPIFSCPLRFAQIYSRSLNIHFYPLQRINDDTILFYRTVHVDGSDVLAKTVFVLARLRIDTGYMILFKSIDRHALAFAAATHLHHHHDDQGLNDVWVDKYSWVTVHEQGEHACLFHFGGATLTNLWLKEVLFIALRWETMAVGPQVTLEL